MTFEIEEKNKSLTREVKASEANNQMFMGVIQGKIQVFACFLQFLV
jgi:hypothetical protein